MDGVIPQPPENRLPSLEEMDFFEVPANRELILNREGNRCFYCLGGLNGNNYVIEHVISRPEGDNSYRNLVASCRQCNNKKGSSEAADFLRILYRDGFLTSNEFQDRLSHLERLQAGELKPSI